MLFHIGLVLMSLNCVRTTEYVYDFESDNSFTSWPSMHNALTRLQKRDVPQSGLSEGGSVDNRPGEISLPLPPVSSDALNPVPGPIKPSLGPKQPTQQPPTPQPVISNAVPKDTKVDTPSLVKANDTISNAVIDNQNDTLQQKQGNLTGVALSPTQLDMTQPGVMMRGVIVFGGFLLLAVAYIIFYRTKNNKNELTNNHNSNENTQFRYGVLESEDRRGNMELSRVPLTMESDEDEDDDLEIFDLEQKKKSLSYVNLQTNDEDIVFDNSNAKEDKESLLLDIEDPINDALINWSNNVNK